MENPMFTDNRDDPLYWEITSDEGYRPGELNEINIAEMEADDLEEADDESEETTD